MERKRFSISSIDEILAALHLGQKVDLGVDLGESSEPTLVLFKESQGPKPFGFENLRAKKILNTCDYMNYDQFRSWLHAQLDFEYPLYWESK